MFKVLLSVDTISENSPESLKSIICHNYMYHIYVWTFFGRLHKWKNLKRWNLYGTFNNFPIDIPFKEEKNIKYIT